MRATIRSCLTQRRCGPTAPPSSGAGLRRSALCALGSQHFAIPSPSALCSMFSCLPVTCNSLHATAKRSFLRLPSPLPFAPKPRTSSVVRYSIEAGISVPSGDEGLAFWTPRVSAPQRRDGTEGGCCFVSFHAEYRWYSVCERTPPAPSLVCILAAHGLSVALLPVCVPSVFAHLLACWRVYLVAMVTAPPPSYRCPYRLCARLPPQMLGAAGGELVDLVLQTAKTSTITGCGHCAYHRHMSPS